jgi:dTDP-4-dehydrorhamnose 3,5-epimerase
MSFKIESEHFGGEVKVISQSIHLDHRGFFSPTFRQDKFKALGLPHNFIQDNYSYSTRNVLRGLHFQLTPAMGKLMRVTRGRAFLVAVDIRWDSPTFLQWHGIVASAQNMLQVWAPAEFARGFYAYADPTVVEYKCDEYFSEANDGAIQWNSPEIGIDWPTKIPILSERDKNAPTVSQYFGNLQRKANGN